MPAVVTTASTLLCPHGAPLVIRPSQHLLAVDGQPVLVEADLESAAILICPNIGAGLTPCTKVQSVDGGLSTALMIGGQPVVLASVVGQTDGTPQPPLPQRLVSMVNQTKLEAA